LAEIYLARDHGLGLPRAREVALVWVAQARHEFGLRCTYQETEQEDLANFIRPGVSGTLRVSHTQFELTAKLGFLLSAFKDRIEADLQKNLDQLLAVTPDRQNLP
jgi:putative polyhydroxyalkanoate system protein